MSAKDTAEEHPVISIARTGDTYLNETPVNIHRVAEEVRRRFKGQDAVYVRDDKNLPDGELPTSGQRIWTKPNLKVMVVTKPEDRSKVKCVAGDPRSNVSRCSAPFTGALALTLALSAARWWCMRHLRAIFLRIDRGSQCGQRAAVGIEASEVDRCRIVVRRIRWRTTRSRRSAKESRSSRQGEENSTGKKCGRAQG